MLVYATADNLADYVTPVPSNAALLLTRASRVVRQATLTAVYAVGEDGLPTDPDTLAAFTAATCEQVAYGLEGGDATGTGASAGYQRMRIGSVELDRGSGGGAAARASSDDLAPQARLVLANAGLLGEEPYSR